MTTRVGEFSVNILGDTVKKINRDSDSLYAMKNKTKYEIELRNNGNRRCDAFVYIDGDFIGAWRINSFSSITLKRPAETDRQFIFVSEDSEESKMVGTISGAINNGLIKVEFKPEKRCCFREPYFLSCDCDSFGTMSDCCYNMSNSIPKSCYNDERGNTILGENTNQIFGKTEKIRHYDSTTTINIRLIIDRNRDNNNNASYISIHEARTVEPTNNIWNNWNHNCCHCHHHCCHCHYIGPFDDFYYK